jgi:VacB/RNase II family 3'-5' exoribonuclease
MSTPHDGNNKIILERIARRVMMERGFLTDFSQAALDELKNMHEVDWQAKTTKKDLRQLLWASIDNDDSLDLDQLTVAEVLPDEKVKILVAVADVDNLVKKNSAIDEHARQNTTSVYTAGETFPMLPERLSTDLTSLNYQEDRPAIVVEMIISGMGEILSSDIYPAEVRNHAKFAYNAVAAWLQGKVAAPDKTMVVDPSLAENLLVQDRVAQKLRSQRHQRGALELQTLEARPVFAGDQLQDLQAEETNPAKEIIEDFMIAANDVTALFLQGKQIPSLRRVVRSPKRWDRIVEVAAQHNFQLPAEPDSKALSSFLTAQKAADPLRFPDLSLVIIKLLGSGEYVVELPNEVAPGHFGLAVKDYTHSTAPNRRFPDLITQRILKATLEGSPIPYSQAELVVLAKYCTEKEDDANKVERQVAKSAAAMLLSSRIGDQYGAICTGAADKGTWVRIFHPPVEGRLLHGYEGVDVGNRLKVRLIHIDVDKGFIDFEKVQSNL